MRFVIIGAGQAAAQAVATLASEGFSGSLTVVGEEPYPPYQRPPLSKAYMAGDFVRERLFLKPEAFYAESHCELRLGVTAAAIDRAAKTVTLSSGDTLAYDRLLFATGDRVRKLPCPGADLPGVYYLRGIDDSDALRRHLVAGKKLAVVGGGYIGLEVAAVVGKYGLHVTVVEAMDRLMVRSASPQVSEFYRKLHESHGVDIRLNQAVTAVEGKSWVEAVATGQGRIPADIVVAGIGVVPNCELALVAGLACDNGIVVDEFGATSDPDIFAAGDCTNHVSFHGKRVRLESVQNAIDQAKHAALAMLGKPTPYREVPWFWSDQYDIKLQIAGLVQPGDTAVVRGDPSTHKFSVFHLRDGIVAGVEAVNAAPDYIAGRRLIAARARVAPERIADTSVPAKQLG
ncbi:MAG: FAD-dependent oxidoreductase [Alphaproteobacteria bacterium]|nr:FAD-dependent oxidoreductase [Alphaproteobacteria bacterium]